MPEDSHAGSPLERDQLLSVKETLVGIVIAFVMAFVFRGFVIEGFVIPTGSMAPTLLGEHFRAVGPESGYGWDVGPTPRSGSMQDLDVTDPVLGTRVTQPDARRRSGDRVFVLKYLDGIHEPKRWDVVVFKNPGTRETYIKRLLGKPGEQIALVDGDVFARDFESGTTSTRGAEAWREEGWGVQRKGERVQRAVWQPVFDARYTPRRPGPGYRAPFEGGAGWDGLTGSGASGHWTFSGTGTGTLTWRDNVPIEDWYAYNELQHGRVVPHFPVSDMAVSMSVEPEEGVVVPEFELGARGYVFQARVVEGASGLEGVVRMRDAGASDWIELDRGPVGSGAFTSGRATPVEFWHVDQALWLFVDGELVCGGPETGAYELSPAQRVERTTGNTLEEALERPGYGNGVSTAGGLADFSQYRKPTLAVRVAGGPASVHAMKVDRDLHYHINTGNKPTNGAHPDFFPTLSDERYFVCGDNSPNSKDSRLWAVGDGSPDPWVAYENDPGIPSIDRSLMTEAQAREFEATVGTVHRDLLIGQGFLVYFPAPKRVFGVPVPDVGRARWIW